MIGYFFGGLLCLMSIIDRHGGDGVVSANIELAIGYLIFTVQVGIDKITEKLS